MEYLDRVPFWRMLILPAALCLLGCVTDRTSAPDVPTQPVKVICLPMANYSQADLDEFASEVAGLQPTTQKQVIRFLGDYKAMREANRACHASP